VSSGFIDTDKRGHFDPLVERGLATRETLPYEYRTVYRFKPTADGVAANGG